MREKAITLHLIKINIDDCDGNRRQKVLFNSCGKLEEEVKYSSIYFSMR